MSQGSSSGVFADPRAVADGWQRPTVRPAAAPTGGTSDASSEDAVDLLVLKVMSLDLLATVMFQRVYIGVSITLFTHFLAFAYLLWQGRLRLSGIRIILYWLFWGAALAGQMLSGNTYSSSSIMLGMTCYATFIGVVPASEQTYFAFIKVFQKVSLGIAVLVLVDMALQVAGLGMPNMDDFMPGGMIPRGMNYLQPIVWGSPIMKPNAFFMLEASSTSQMVALGLLFELSLFRRWRRLVTYGLALLLTFSGTGLMLLIVCLPVLMRRFWRPVLLYSIIVLPILAGLAVATGWYEIESTRADSFDTRNSSANARFVAPFETMYDIATSHDVHLILFGYGAGKTSVEQIVPGLDTSEFNAVSKIFTEYGFVIAVLFLAFIGYCGFTTQVPFVIMYAAAMEYHFMGGHLLLPPNINFLYLLSAGWAVWKLPPASRITGVAVAAQPAGS